MTTTLIILIVILALTAISSVIYAVKVKTTKTETVEESTKITTSSTTHTERTVISNKRPIDKVIDFIDTDMENIGYDDAKNNNNNNTVEEKITELREKGKDICRLAIIEYEQKISETTAEINKCDKAGLFSTKEKLEAQNKIFKEQYIEEIKRIQKEIENKDILKPVFSSYRRGFLKWIEESAISLIQNNKGGS